MAAERSFVDFFKPMDPAVPLVREGSWGVDAVMPRDTTNGLEDTQLKDWCYWDGTIILCNDGKYRMYASRWSQGYSHRDGWHIGTQGMVAVSDNLFGPYRDMGLAWPNWREGFGHNVVALRLKDGRYAMLSSEVTDGEVFVSDSADGPFEWLGTVRRNSNGFYGGWMEYDELDLGALRGGGIGRMSNIVAIIRHDGRYQIMPRQCGILISDDDILGEYKLLGDRAWWGVEGVPQCRQEDPTFWYSDGQYHLVVNQYSGGDAYHLTSDDGIDNWRNRGIAFSDEKEVFKYTSGQVNHWGCVQRPTVYVEDGEVKAFHFSVVDTGKGGDRPNDKHGSKIVVLPFDGKGFSEHIKKVVSEEQKRFDKTPLPEGWQAAAIGSARARSGYESDHKTMRLRSLGEPLEGEEDKLSYIYKPIDGDISLTSKVLYQDMTKADFEAGLMLRSSLDGSSKSVIATLSNNKGLTISTRKGDGAEMESENFPEIKAPYWLRMERRKDEIECFVSTSNMMNWRSVAKLNVELGDEIYAGLVAASGKSGSSELARFKQTDLHRYGEPQSEGVISHTFPDRIPADGVVDFEIEYENDQSLDVWVELECIKTGKKYPVLRQAMLKNRGTMSLQYNAGEQLSDESAYWFVIKSVPLHLHDTKAVQSSFKRVEIEK